MMKRFKTIGDFLQNGQLPKSEHPLISVLQLEPVTPKRREEPDTWVYDFYCIAIKRVTNARHFKLKYGQSTYDFDDGIMSFIAPDQVVSLAISNENEEMKQSGWMLIIHPDFLWNTPLSKTIKQYGFWEYSVNEALFLSEREEEILIGILQNIQRECNSNIDKFSKQIIVAQIESFLSYSDRFYHRQFITREKEHHQVLDRLETLLTAYFNGDDLIDKGLPTVQGIADELHLSATYLSDLLRTLTGENTQQHIHNKLIAKAKEKLSVTDLSISEIAYELGFKHLQSFTKLFKTKTNQSPMEFRASFN